LGRKGGEEEILREKLKETEAALAVRIAMEEQIQ
jgi:hypothetical protein